MAKKKSGPDLAARFAKIGDAIVTEGEKKIVEIGGKVRDAAARNADRGASGKLAAGYAVKLRHRGVIPVAVVGTLVPYATYFEFAKEINGHAYAPETPTPRALYKALDDNVKEIEQMIADAVGRGLGAVSGP